jgi:hypothetical protein
MAYKQNPGRGNSPKTGHGIPTPFKQMTGEEEKYNLTTNNKFDKARETQLKTGDGSRGFGVTVKNGIATADAYEKKYVKSSGTNDADRVVDTTTKNVVRESTNNVGKRGQGYVTAYSNKKTPIGKEDLRAGFIQDSTSTMAGRNNHADYINAVSGQKENLSTTNKKDIALAGYGTASRINPTKESSKSRFASNTN